MSVETFTLQKLGSQIEENDDAFDSVALDCSSEFWFAIADGATESFQSGRWAQALVKAYVSDRPDKLTNGWVRQVAFRFSQLVDYTELPWYLVQKALAGSYSTLLTLRVDIVGRKWRLESIGDCCLALVYHEGGNAGAENRIAHVRVFPDKARRIEWYTSRPELVGSSDDAPASSFSRALQSVGRGKTITFLLMTDALAAWLIASQKARAKQLMSVASQEEFSSFVQRARELESLQNDDTTLARLTIKFD